MKNDILKKFIELKGYKYEYVCKRMNAEGVRLSYPAFHNKINGRNEWKISEFVCICKILQLTKGQVISLLDL